VEIRKCDDRCCNECHSQENVKEIKVGGMVIALCNDCREKLLEILSKEND